MYRFLGDLLVGWIVFTPKGKEIANKIVSSALNTVKDSIINSSPIKDVLSNKGKNNESTNVQNNKSKN